MKIGANHGTPVAKIMIKYILMKKEIQTKISFPLLRAGPGIPDTKDKSKDPNFGE